MLRYCRHCFLIKEATSLQVTATTELSLYSSCTNHFCHLLKLIWQSFISKENQQLTAYVKCPFMQNLTLTYKKAGNKRHWGSTHGQNDCSWLGCPSSYKILGVHLFYVQNFHLHHICMHDKFLSRNTVFHYYYVSGCVCSSQHYGSYFFIACKASNINRIKVHLNVLTFIFETSLYTSST